MKILGKRDMDLADAREKASSPGPLLPRDAATLILLDRSQGAVRVLMGRRHMGHAFMPGKFVFPGGRTDPSDGRVAVASLLHPNEEQQLVAGPGRVSPARARAIALSGIRETYEEAGLLIGEPGTFVAANPQWQGFADHSVRPALHGLRLIARAITPPGRIRRFDTRFLSAWRSDVALELREGGPTQELEELVWLPIDEARRADIPNITRFVLEDLEQRLAQDPKLAASAPTPFYRMTRNKFVRELL